MQQSPRIGAALCEEALLADSGLAGEVVALGWASENSTRRRNNPGRPLTSRMTRVLCLRCIVGSHKDLMKDLNDEG